jgi:hypothetical protein
MLLALLLAPAAAARAQVAGPPAPGPAVPAAPTTAGPPAEASAVTKRFSVTAGWGYYEVSHVGAAYHFSERAALALFGGYGVGPSDQGVTIGTAFSHALFGPIWGFQPGWDVKAIYWTQSDENYDWKNLSLVLGPRLEADLGNGLRFALDAGVALSFALESDRKQDFTFGSPTRWNGSVCLEIGYRLGGR